MLEKENTVRKRGFLLKALSSTIIFQRYSRSVLDYPVSLRFVFTKGIAKCKPEF